MNFNNFFVFSDLFIFKNNPLFFDLDLVDNFFISDNPDLVIFLLDCFNTSLISFNRFFLHDFFQKKNFFEIELKSLHQIYSFLFHKSYSMKDISVGEGDFLHFENVFDKFFKDEFFVLSWYDFFEKDQYINLNPAFSYHKLVEIYNDFYYDELKFINKKIKSFFFIFVIFVF